MESSIRPKSLRLFRILLLHIISPGGSRLEALIFSRGVQGGDDPCSLAGAYMLQCGAPEQLSAKGGVDVDSVLRVKLYVVYKYTN